MPLYASIARAAQRGGVEKPEWCGILRSSDEREVVTTVALVCAALVVFLCRARPSIVSAGASPPRGLGIWSRAGCSVGTE